MEKCKTKFSLSGSESVLLRVFFVADAFLHRSEKFGMCGSEEIESGPQGGDPVLSIGADLRKQLEICKLLTKLVFILEL